MRVRLTPRAVRELLAQTDWLSQRSPTAARAASKAIRATVERAALFPLAAPLVDETHRDVRVRFGRDGFFVRYRLEGDEMVVVGVFHGRQLR